MPNKTNTLPIGKLLHNADLISIEQLELALKIQAQYTEMRLGEILSLQEAVEIQTINFFVEKWEEITQEGQQFPLGYYLKKACLLNEQQIQTVLAEQKKSNLKFGDLVVQKGWLKRGTIDFFLKGLALEDSRLMSLIDLENYDQKSLHLSKKYANSDLILGRILAWTGGNPKLTKSICQEFARSGFNISSGMEASVVDKFVETSLIKNWQTAKLGTYIRSLRESLLNSQNCEPILLLSEYEKVLLTGDRDYQQLKEQEELLNLGLIIKDNHKLRVTNLIFQQIFNQNWLIKNKKNVEQKIQQETNTIIKLEAATPINKIDQKGKVVATSLDEESTANKIESIKNINIKKTEPLTKISSLLTLAGMILLIPLTIGINNYYFSTKEKQLAFPSFSTSQASKLKQFCNEIDLTDSSSALKLKNQIEKSKREILRAFPNTLEVFPDNCETVLNQLRVLAAPQLGKENRVVEAIKNLCKIPGDAENINEAKIWIEHWSNSASWGKETKSYLRLINDCPAHK